MDNYKCKDGEIDVLVSACNIDTVGLLWLLNNYDVCHVLLVKLVVSFIGTIRVSPLRVNHQCV